MQEEQPRVTSWRHAFTLMLCGFCMGAADLVPGVSGGTMAFITGIYEDLLRSIKSVSTAVIKDLLCFRWQKALEQVAWRYLLCVGMGAVLAMGALAGIVLILLGDKVSRAYLFAIFMGLILGSVVFCLRKVQHWRLQECAILLLGILLALGITSSRPKALGADSGYDVELTQLPAIGVQSQKVSNYDTQRQVLLGVKGDELAAMWAKGLVEGGTPVFSHIEGRLGTVAEFVEARSQPLLDWWLILCGMIAISAMLLPGISGSYLLTVLGVYPLVIGAFADFAGGLRSLSLDLEAGAVIFSVGMGILLGLAVFSRLITWLLRTHHDATVALLIGFMLGALRSVWPFWSYSYYLIPLKLHKGLQLLPLKAVWPGLSSTLFLNASALMCLACGLVLALELLALRFARR